MRGLSSVGDSAGVLRLVEAISAATLFGQVARFSQLKA
jgi:hypothetical protein